MVAAMRLKSPLVIPLQKVETSKFINFCFFLFCFLLWLLSSLLFLDFFYMRCLFRFKIRSFHFGMAARFSPNINDKLRTFLFSSSSSYNNFFWTPTSHPRCVLHLEDWKTKKSWLHAGSCKTELPAMLYSSWSFVIN